MGFGPPVITIHIHPVTVFVSIKVIVARAILVNAIVPSLPRTRVCGRVIIITIGSTKGIRLEKVAVLVKIIITLAILVHTVIPNLGSRGVNQRV